MENLPQSPEAKILNKILDSAEKLLGNSKIAKFVKKYHKLILGVLLLISPATMQACSDKSNDNNQNTEEIGNNIEEAENTPTEISEGSEKEQGNIYETELCLVKTKFNISKKTLSFENGNDAITYIEVTDNESGGIIGTNVLYFAGDTDSQSAPALKEGMSVHEGVYFVVLNIDLTQLCDEGDYTLSKTGSQEEVGTGTAKKVSVAQMIDILKSKKSLSEKETIFLSKLLSR